jgi:hypothetical protein
MELGISLGDLQRDPETDHDHSAGQYANKEASWAHAGWPRAKSAIMAAKEVFAASSRRI